jgi:serine/threonine protein kinase
VRGKSAWAATFAVKIIVEHRKSPEDRDRFLREARFLAQLDHPNIVPIYDYGIDTEDRCFYTMKLVRGRTLKHIMSALSKGLESWTIERRLEVFRKVSDGIAFAHSRGVIHRDLKPENIMVGEFGEVLIVDWGLAGDLNAMDEDGSAGLGLQASPLQGKLIDSDAALTLEGQVLGTPQYMAPEQANARADLDERCDIYALGGVLYSILTLRPPLRKSEVNEMLESVRAGKIEPFFLADGVGPGDDTSRITPALAAVIRKAMALDREHRFASVGELASDVDAYLSGFATSAEQFSLARQFWLLVRRHRTASLAGLLLIILFVVFVAQLITSEDRANQSAFVALRSETVAKNSEAQTRIALAQARIALADSAYAANDSARMRDALDSVPADLRDSAWRYLNVRTDERQSRPAWNGDSFHIGSAAHPTEPGVFTVATSADTRQIIDFEARTGKPLRNFTHRGGWVRSIAYSPDHSRIALGRIMGEGISIHRAEDGAQFHAPHSFRTGRVSSRLLQCATAPNLYNFAMRPQDVPFATCVAASAESSRFVSIRFRGICSLPVLVLPHGRSQGTGNMHGDFPLRAC